MGWSSWGTGGDLWQGWELCGKVSEARTISLLSRGMGVRKDGQLIVLLNVKQSIKELALEDTDDPVQRLLQLAVFLHRALFGPDLILLPLV